MHKVGAGQSRQSIVPTMTAAIAGARASAAQEAAINGIIGRYEGLTRVIAQGIVNGTERNFPGVNPAGFRQLKTDLVAAGLVPTVQTHTQSYATAAQAAAAIPSDETDADIMEQLAREMGVPVEQVRSTFDAV